MGECSPFPLIVSGNPMTRRVERKLKKIAKSLNKASRTHKGQAREITKIVKKKAKTRRRK